MHIAENTCLKVKVMLPLFTTCRWMGSSGTVAFILTLITWWKQVDSFTPPRKDPQVPLKSRLCGPQSSLNTLERRQISCLCWGGANLRLSKSIWLHRAPQDYAWVWSRVTIKWPCCWELNPDTLDAWPVLIQSKCSRLKWS